MESLLNTRLRNWVLSCFMLLLLCVTFLQPVSAASVVYDGWVLVGKTITVADQEVKLKAAAGDDWEQLLLNTDEGSFIISKADCKKGSYYEYCYTESRYELGVYGEWDYTTLTEIPEIHLVVNDIAPRITVSASTDKSSLAVNEQATITVTVKNEGSLVATNLEYTAVLPDSVLLLRGSDGVSISGSVLTWKGTSVPGNDGKKEFSYTFKVETNENISFTGNLTYEAQDNSYSKSHSQVSITVIESVKVATFSLSKTSASINEQVTLTALITNTDLEYEGRINSFIITVPKGVDIVEKDSALSGTGKTLSWEGTIPKNGSKSFEVVVKTVKSGTYTFSGVLEAEVYSATGTKWLKQDSSHEQTLTVSLSALAPSIEFVLGKSSVDGGEQTGYRVQLNNPDTKTTYFDIEYTITSDLNENVSETLTFLAPGTKKLMFSNYFNAPISAEETKYSINFSGKYRTNNYEEFTFRKETTLTISKEVFEQLIELTRILPESMQKGSSIEVVLIVRNLQENDIKLLKLTDTVTGAEVASGTSSRQINVLKPNESIEAYRYTINVPAGTKESAVVVKTQAEFDYKDKTLRHYTQYVENSASITEPEGDGEPEPWAELPTPPPEGEQGTSSQPGDAPSQPTTEKESFFARLINSIREFFQRLF